MIQRLKKIGQDYKSGFTLIELLAIIAILGMIALTTYPAVSSVIEYGEEKAYKEQVKRIEESALSYVSKNVSTVLPEGTESAVVTIADLRTHEFIKKSDVINPKTNKAMNGCVLITKDSYGQYNATYQENNC